MSKLTRAAPRSLEQEGETMNQKLTKLAMMSGLAIALTGCGGGGYYAYSAPPPPPRPLAYGVVGVAPGRGYVWVDGYQDWRSNRYVWVPGSWRRPPHPRAVWVPGHFQRHNRGNVWITGRWRY